MTDKPDVAALVAELTEHASMYGGMTRIKFDKAIAELTRLAAERKQTYELAYSVARHDMDNQLSDAKAEIARLREALQRKPKGMVVDDETPRRNLRERGIAQARAALKPDTGE